MDFYNKYVKYKVKNIELLQIFYQQGGEFSTCFNTKFKKIKEYITEVIIPIGSILFSGSVKTYPTALNDIFQKIDNQYVYKFFTFDINIAKTYSNTPNNTNGAYVGVYKTTKNMTVYVQDPYDYDNSIFFMNSDYHKPCAQCLCYENHNGYASYNNKFGIDDIGICNSYDSMDFIGYYKQKELFTIFYDITGNTIQNINFDNSEIIKQIKLNIDPFFLQ